MLGYESNKKIFFKGLFGRGKLLPPLVWSSIRPGIIGRRISTWDQVRKWEKKRQSGGPSLCNPYPSACNGLVLWWVLHLARVTHCPCFGLSKDSLLAAGSIFLSLSCELEHRVETLSGGPTPLLMCVCKSEASCFVPNNLRFFSDGGCVLRLLSIQKRTHKI